MPKGLTRLWQRTLRHQWAARTTPGGPGCPLTASAYARCELVRVLRDIKRLTNGERTWDLI